MPCALQCASRPPAFSGHVASLVRQPPPPPSSSLSLSPGIIFSPNVRDIGELLSDDEAAEREAAAQNGVPGYCSDRYFKAYAGGERVCEKFEKGR